MEQEWVKIPEKPQKFKRGNLVHIAKNLGSMMDHFTNDVDAIIIGSYKDQYGGSNTESYTVMFADDGSTCSWYEEDQLTLLDEGGEYLIEEAEKIAKAWLVQATDLKWIVENWSTSDAFSAATILFLFEKIGYQSSFLRNGEYIALYSDWWGVLPFFDFLIKIGVCVNVDLLKSIKTPEKYIPKFIELSKEIQAIKNEKP